MGHNYRNVSIGQHPVSKCAPDFFAPRNAREMYDYCYRQMRALAYQDKLPLMKDVYDPIERKALQSLIVLRTEKRGVYGHPTARERLQYWRKRGYDISFMMAEWRRYSSL